MKKISVVVTSLLLSFNSFSQYDILIRNGKIIAAAKGASIPADAVVLPVGGITLSNMQAYLSAGASGFGIGSALYKPGMTAANVAKNATQFIAACAGI